MTSPPSRHPLPSASDEALITELLRRFPGRTIGVFASISVHAVPCRPARYEVAVDAFVSGGPEIVVFDEPSAAAAAFLDRRHRHEYGLDHEGGDDLFLTPNTPARADVLGETTDEDLISELIHRDAGFEIREPQGHYIRPLDCSVPGVDVPPDKLTFAVGRDDVQGAESWEHVTVHPNDAARRFLRAIDGLRTGPGSGT